jgi:hypothetical protein
MPTLTDSFPCQGTKSLYHQASDIEFDAILRLDGIEAMAHMLHLALQEGGATPSYDTILNYCAVIMREVEAIKKDVGKITEMKGRG